MKSGQKGADGRFGAIRVPTALFATALFAQLQVNVSTASDLGFQYRELNLGNLLIWKLANLSIVCGPQAFSNLRNKYSAIPQSSLVCDPTQAICFFILRSWDPIKFQGYAMSYA